MASHDVEMGNGAPVIANFDTSYTFRAVIRKNLVYQKRQKRTLCCQICVPVFIIVLVGVLQIIFTALLNKQNNQPFTAEAKNDEASRFAYGAYGGMAAIYGSANGMLDLGYKLGTGNGTGFWNALLQQQNYQTDTYQPTMVQQTGANTASTIDDFLYKSEETLVNDFREFAAAHPGTPQLARLMQRCQTPGLPQPCPPPPPPGSPAMPPQNGNNQLPCYTTKPTPDALARELYANCDTVKGRLDDVAAFYVYKSEHQNIIPNAAVVMNAVDGSNLKLDITLQTGNIFDPFDDTYQSLSNVVSNWQEGNSKAGFLLEAIVNTFAENYLNTSVYISGGYKQMPYITTKPAPIDIIGFIAALVFPIATSLLLPVFVQFLVMEKEMRLMEMQKMMGLRTRDYYIVAYAYFFLMYAAAIIFFIIVGALAFRISWFTTTDPGVYLLLFFMWGNVKIAMAFLISTIFSKTRTAVVICYLLTIFGVIIQFVLNLVLYAEKRASQWMIGVWPPFAYYRGVYLISQAINNPLVPQMAFKNIDINSEMSVVFGFMAWQIIVCLILAWYLDQVMPRQFGIRKPVWFPITELINCVQRMRGNEYREVLLADDGVHAAEDDDVAHERDFVDKLARFQDHGLVVRNVRKEYDAGFHKTKKLALVDPSFVVNYGECFGLLGPNGAGKSTLISILTGLYMPTSGTAFVDGFNIRTHMHEIHHRMGVCPQHDILWDDLTVREHLLFYARLKGVPHAEERAHVEEKLQNMELVERADHLSKELSGGQKRRLSIGIALTGNNRVIFMDEPTTGLDPETRRTLWKVIQDARAGRCLLLTTHSMEEADVLCNRIGIVSQGRLKCIGGQQHLKSKFGMGFKLTMNCVPNMVDEAIAHVQKLEPKAEVLTRFVARVTMRIPKEELRLSRLFKKLEKSKDDKGILDWGISQTSLEEVFLSLVSEDEAAGR